MAHFAGAGEADSSNDCKHSRGPPDVKSLSYFIPGTQGRVSVSQFNTYSYHTTTITTSSTLPYPRIERVKEFLSDIESVPGDCDHSAQTF